MEEQPAEHQPVRAAALPRPTTSQWFALLLAGYLGTAGARSLPEGPVGALVLVAGAVLAYRLALRADAALLRRSVTTPARVVVGLSTAMVLFLASAKARDLLLASTFR